LAFRIQTLTPIEWHRFIVEHYLDPQMEAARMHSSAAFLGLVGGAEVLSRWRGNDVLDIALIPEGAL
jgi:hypothetical protein